MYEYNGLDGTGSECRFEIIGYTDISYSDFAAFEVTVCHVLKLYVVNNYVNLNLDKMVGFHDTGKKYIR